MFDNGTTTLPDGQGSGADHGPEGGWSGGHAFSADGGPTSHERPTTAATTTTATTANANVSCQASLLEPRLLGPCRRRDGGVIVCVVCVSCVWCHRVCRARVCVCVCVFVCVCVCVTFACDCVVVVVVVVVTTAAAAAAATTAGISWSEISRAYNTTVPLEDGTSVRFVSRGA
jgi:hypothetical protein